MTPEQRYDRLERIARLLYEAARRSNLESRQQTKKLKLYVEAQNQCEAAKRAVEELPEDQGRNERLTKARQLLEQASKDLKH
jgi:hypothetical protein